MRIFTSLSVAFVLLALPAAAQDKVALVVGNSQYRDIVALRNPAVDAARAEDIFESLGFDTISVLEADQAAMRSALGEFMAASEGADVAVIYYAGHGVQIDNRNYLLPVDSRADTPEALFQSSVPVEEVIASIAPSAGASLVMLDACRDNPFAELTRSLNGATRGLARGDYRAQDMMILYAAQPGEVALDGDGSNSPFMQALGEVLLQGGEVKLNDALIDVAAHVRTATRDRQIPYVEGSMTRHVAFGTSRSTQDAPAKPGICPGGTLDPLTMDHDGDRWVGLEDRERVITFGGDVTVCLTGEGLGVDGAFPAAFSCEDLLDPVNEGAGYYFRDAGGGPAHVWLYADPAAAEKTVELGFYREEEELVWVSTGWPICR